MPPSNQKKMEEKKRCRQKLSEHIQTRLGIVVEPTQVRLRTEYTKDPYIWERMAEKNHLFSKNISDHSIGSLMELSEGVGVYFTAVPRPTTGQFQTGTMMDTGIDLLDGGISLTQRIEELQESEKWYVSELNEQKAETASQSRMRRQAEEEIVQLKNILQELQTDRKGAEWRIHDSKSEANRFRMTATRYYEGLTKIWSVLDEMKPELPLRNHDTGLVAMSDGSSSSP